MRQAELCGAGRSTDRAEIPAELIPFKDLSVGAGVKLRFRSPGAFTRDLRTRAAPVLKTLPPGGVGAAGVVKAVVAVSWFTLSWVIIIGGPRGLAVSAAEAVSLALSIAAVGIGAAHDALHGSLAAKRWVNRFFGMSLDLVGGSSTLWKIRHNQGHHTYTNIDGMDEDLDNAPHFRMSPSHDWSWWHQFQHIYAPLLYCLMALKWVLWRDLAEVSTLLRRRNSSRRPLLSVFGIVGGKIPLILFFWAAVESRGPAAAFAIGLSGYLLTGLIMAILFQVGHCSTGLQPDYRASHFPEWDEHQVRTTANFKVCDVFTKWMVGGLSHQIEHHLFPKVPHRHLYLLSPVVQSVCLAHGIPYVSHASLLAAVKEHFLFLSKLGVRPQDTRSGQIR